MHVWEKNDKPSKEIVGSRNNQVLLREIANEKDNAAVRFITNQAKNAWRETITEKV